MIDDSIFSHFVHPAPQPQSQPTISRNDIINIIYSALELNRRSLTLPSSPSSPSSPEVRRNDRIEGS